MKKKFVYLSFLFATCVFTLLYSKNDNQIHSINKSIKKASITSQRDALIAIYNANPENTLRWDLENPNIGNWAGVTTDDSGNVIELNFNNRHLSTIPAEIGQLVNLSYLNLRTNNLTTLPAEIGQLVNLTSLDLRRNDLTTLPTEIGQLVNLTYLNLSVNELTTLPPEISQLRNLKSLDLSENPLKTIPLIICDNLIDSNGWTLLHGVGEEVYCE